MPRPDLGGRADVDDPVAFHVEGPVFDQTQLRGELAPPRCRGASQGEEFRRMHDEEGSRSRGLLPFRRANLVRSGRAHGNFFTPTGSGRTTKALPPAARIASAVFSGRSVRATMLPPPPAPVSFAP